MAKFSDFIVYVDESGDHGMSSIDPKYPVFVLAFCVCPKEKYVNRAVPALQNMKFKYFGHDMVVFHEREIRKGEGDFVILADRHLRDEFLEDLNTLMDSMPFTLFAACIKKDQHRDRYSDPDNPYHLAMAFGLERIFLYLRRKDQGDRKTHFVFEQRGKREDDELELEFRRVCDGGNYLKRKLPFEIVFADKRSNSCGLQLADLVARPIGRKILMPEQKNRAFEHLEPKFDHDSDGQYDGRGLKIFP